jgi:regulator of sigma E protease
MIVSIIVFLLVLSVLVLAHEFGHFIVAKRAGIWVEEFGLGLPPRIYGAKIGETIYSINALPFGGFVRLHGEEGETKEEPGRAFINKDKKTRAAVTVAGVVMNFLLGILAFSIVYSFLGLPRTTTNVKIVDIDESSPAKTAGLAVGDVVRGVDGNKVESVKGFIGAVEEKKGKRITLMVERGNEEVKISVTPRENPPEGEGPLGVAVSDTEIYYPPLWQRPFVGAYEGVNEALFWSKAVIQGLVKMVGDLVGGRVPAEVTGPVGIYAVTTEATKQGGILGLINILGVLSINLGLINILPFPALDGGRLLFIGIERLVGKRVLPKLEATIHLAGMVILLLLIAAITIHDIRSIIAAGSITGFLNNVVK